MSEASVSATHGTESSAFDHDLTVIGSGPGGYRAAVYAALRGLSVCIIERGVWGGCCLNRGCVPKKDWYHSARLIAAQRHFEARGIDGRLSGDLIRAWAHQKTVVDTIRDSYITYLKHLKIRTLQGHARFDGAQRIVVEVDGAEPQSLTTASTIIATGAHASVPEPFSEVPGRILTTDTLFDHDPPEGDRVAVIGSGVVATEMAFILTMLGRKVTWLSRSEPLSRERFTPQARNVLKDALERHGVSPIRVHGYDRVDVTNQVSITCGETTHHVDWVLLGTGRTPNTADLGLETLGLDAEPGRPLKRKSTLQLQGVDHVYAIGDVASRWMTANHALSDAKIAVDNILAQRSGDAPGHFQDGRYVPVAIYSATEMARFGLDEDQAEDEDFEPATGFAAFETNPRALGEDDADGFVRLLSDMDSGKLLGAEIVGGEAGELIHLLTLSPSRDQALPIIAGGIWNHPSRGEEVLNATETLAAKWNLQGAIFTGRAMRPVDD